MHAQTKYGVQILSVWRPRSLPLCFCDYTHNESYILGSCRVTYVLLNAGVIHNNTVWIPLTLYRVNYMFRHRSTSLVLQTLTKAMATINIKIRQLQSADLLSKWTQYFGCFIIRMNTKFWLFYYQNERQFSCLLSEWTQHFGCFIIRMNDILAVLLSEWTQNFGRFIIRMKDILAVLLAEWTQNFGCFIIRMNDILAVSLAEWTQYFGCFIIRMNTTF